MLTDKLKTPGEHRLMLSGAAGGVLEAVLTVPDEAHSRYVAFLGHPHSLQGGTMNNKVVTTLARTFKELSIPSLRFNFRGVGQSSGLFDAGIGESEDMLYLAKTWQQERPPSEFIFAGFSFGSFVAYRAAAQSTPVLLVTIAPPVHHFNYREFKPEPHPWLVVQGEEDEVVPASLVFDFAEQISPPLPVMRFSETGHFFHGKLVELKSRLMAAVQEQVNLP